ncbi:uncharacterized protein LOC126835003 [Adelges cooleyi]|uniref:uncharacterized protein LOC126835003 n=1 Tax=Adelges cooleyi TaxID=133065 RepID=UPI00218022A5|nr:uncharacterized protein LOC126835003 [Adelges cooleyi]
MESVHTLGWTLLAVLLLTCCGPQRQCQAAPKPGEGLTPFGFLMAKPFGQPSDHAVMRHISFKPNDGAKFRESFEKKHGPRGRDLIDSLGTGSYKTNTQKTESGITTSGNSTAISIKHISPQNITK